MSKKRHIKSDYEIKFEKAMGQILSQPKWEDEAYVVEAWYDIEDNDPDISTERLFAMTSDITGEEIDSVSDIMCRFNEELKEVLDE